MSSRGIWNMFRLPKLCLNTVALGNSGFAVAAHLGFNGLKIYMYWLDSQRPLCGLQLRRGSKACCATPVMVLKDSVVLIQIASSVDNYSVAANFHLSFIAFLVMKVWPPGRDLIKWPKVRSRRCRSHLWQSLWETGEKDGSGWILSSDPKK